MINYTYKNFPRYSALSLALALSVSASQPSVAGVTLTFDDNVTPSTPPLPFSNSTTADVAFPASTEFRVMTPNYGRVNNGFKDAVFGGESWTFDDAGELIRTANVAALGNSGTCQNSSFCTAPITESVAGFPICTTPSDPNCPTLLQGVDFLGAGDMTILAPVKGSTPGDVYGFATTNIDLGTNTLTVTLPAAHAQWADGSLILGTDPNTADGDKFIKGAGPGVVLSGPITVTSAPGVDPVTFGFVLHGESIMTRDEVTIAGFRGQIAQWELHGNGTTEVIPPALAVAISVAGGTTQECAAIGGSNITFTANTRSLPPGDSVSTVTWSLDGTPVATGPSAEIFASLGSHAVRVEITTTLGGTASSVTSVSVQDSTPPVLDVAFVDNKTGVPVSEITSPKDKLRISIDATDICDADPAVLATAGIDVVDGEVVKVNVASDKIVFRKSSNIQLSVTATDASGNTTMGDTGLLIGYQGHSDDDSDETDDHGQAAH